MGAVLSTTGESSSAARIHPVYARLLCAYLNQAGFDNSTIFRGTALNWAQLTNATGDLGWPQFAALVERYLWLTAKPWAGLELGNINAASAHGPLGYAVLSAPDVRAMMEVLARYTTSRFGVIGIESAASAEGLRLTIRPRVALGRLRHFVYDSCLATFFRLLDTVAPQHGRDVAVEMDGPRPAWADVYHRLLGVDVRFGAPACRVLLPPRILDTACLTADSEAFALACRHCARHCATQGVEPGMSERIRQRLEREDAAIPTLDVLARDWAISRRTLIRRLHNEGTHYRALLDDVRQARARWYLENTDWPVARIAERLGYQDVSNFSRSFKRWFAMTPRAMRQRARAGDHR